ncbi:hypothetical protein MMC07_001837 [Pseudocyphellaria aurata]|nr:hypothetical protein [Pseudocyphellaria aurata]
MTSSEKIIVAFDYYGTLVTPNSSFFDPLSQEFGTTNATEISSRWRRYQLEYTWRLNSMDRYESFSAVTKQSLVQTLKELDLPIRDEFIDSCISRYNRLSPFRDVIELVSELKKASHLMPLIFSNADRHMIDFQALKEVVPGIEVIQHIVTVDTTRHFKPHPDTYHHIAECMGREKSREVMRKMWLVSANPFDIVGAINVGMETVWVDREMKGWKDQLILGKWGTPSVVVHGLVEVVRAIQKYTGGIQE